MILTLRYTEQVPTRHLSFMKDKKEWYIKTVLPNFEYKVEGIDESGEVAFEKWCSAKELKQLQDLFIENGTTVIPERWR